MQEKKSNNWLIVAGIGCVVVLCLCVIVAGAILLLVDQFPEQVPFDIGELTGINEQLPDEPSMDAPPSEAGPDTEPSADSNLQPTTDTRPPAPTGPTGKELTGGQILTDTTLFDDFSSDALNWLVYDDDKTIIKYENQGYSFEITQADYVDWTYVPAPFFPSSLQFDVQGLTNLEDGSFGVNCVYQDESNHYYVEINLAYQDAVFGSVRNGEYITLTEPNADGEYYLELSHLESSPTATNTVRVDCTPNLISLWINGQFEYEVPVTDPFPNQGDMALFMYTYEDLSGGYKVIFDNVLIEE